jgi:eukaryotic-like serine/threonine-protein kinase
MQRLLGILILLGAALTPPLAADWPTFRGNPLQTGMTEEPLPEKLEVLWKFQTKDSIEGCAAIVGDTVYIGSADEHLYALDLASGQEKWRHKLKAPIKASPAFKEWPASIPDMIPKERLLYVGDIDGVFYCLKPETGQVVWQFATEGEIIASANFADDKVLIGSGDETLYCLRGRTGEVVWKFKVPGGPVYPSAAVVDGRTFATGCDSTLHIISIADGKELASVELPAQVGASPAVVGNMFFVGAMSKGIVGIDWKKAKTLWEQDPGTEFYASPAVADGLVVVGGRDKQVYAFKAQTGALAWSFETGKKIDSSPVIAGPRVYIGSNDGNLYVLDLKNGTKIATYPCGSPVTGSPAVSGRRLIVGTRDGIVFCYGAK